MAENNNLEYINEDEEIPVFVFTGFLESGKTTMVHDWLQEEYFNDGRKTVVIVCEEGVIEYNEENLAKKNVSVVYAEKAEDFNEKLLADISRKYKPANILIEHNCMAKIDDTFGIKFPEGWYIEDIITSIDASTFDVYMKNMGAVMSEQFRYSSLVIFNRCTSDTKKANLRANIKALNPPATVLFMNTDGSVEKADDVLPFDFNADVINISDIDYGLWYIDVMENIARYDGKTVHFKGMAIRPDGFPETAFIIGRKAMTCCSDDLAFLKLLCTSDKPVKLDNNDWLEITAEIEYRENDEPDSQVPVLKIKDIKKAEKPETELVYFS